MDFPRLIRTLRHLKPGQMCWRARYMAERRLGILRAPKPPHPAPQWEPGALQRLAALLLRWHALDDRAAAKAAGFRAGKFRLLNREADFANGIDWVSADAPRLWRYQLHYFDGAKELAIAGDADDGGLVLRWQRDWIAANPIGTDVAWDAFTISARLLNWALAAAIWGPPGDEIRQNHLMQARYLETHMERDVQGNHLLKNACALAVAAALTRSEGLDAALRLLRESLYEQILPDGGHFERSPMYHALVLEDLLVVQAVLGPQGSFLQPIIEKMARFLAEILHPDGEIPFFGDSVFGEARRPSVLLALANFDASLAPTSRSLEPSGFYTLRNSPTGCDVIFRGGAAGPGHQMGHAHGDLFSFELSIHGKRVLVNSGTHGYADSPHRAWCRSEAAHNTIDVAGDPQIEAWGAFRVGRRHGAPEVRYTPDREFRGTVKLPHGTTIGRSIAVQGADLQFTDEAIGGRASETLARLHLAPGLVWIAQGDTWAAGATGLQVRVEAGEARTEMGHYFPEFGREESNSVLVLRASGALRYTITHSPRS